MQIFRTGYTFEGWYTAADGGNEVSSTTKYTITTNQTLFAHWSINTYTITYDVNGGDPETAPKQQSGNYNETITLRDDVPTCVGYGFGGWLAKGVKLVDNHWKVDGDITLVADWVKEYTITYRLGYTPEQGKATSSVTTADPSAIIADPFQKRGGYKFLYWEDKATKKQYKAGVAYTDKKDVELVAVWEPYKISFSVNAEDAKWAPGTEVKTKAWDWSGWDYYLPKLELQRDGYIFTGWNTKKDGTGKSLEPEAYIGDWGHGLSKDTTLYATWVKCERIHGKLIKEVKIEATKILFKETSPERAVAKIKCSYCGEVMDGKSHPMTVEEFAYYCDIAHTPYEQQPEITRDAIDICWISYSSGMYLDDAAEMYYIQKYADLKNLFDFGDLEEKWEHIGQLKSFVDGISSIDQFDGITASSRLDEYISDTLESNNLVSPRVVELAELARGLYSGVACLYALTDRNLTSIEKYQAVVSQICPYASIIVDVFVDCCEKAEGFAKSTVINIESENLLVKLDELSPTSNVGGKFLDKVDCYLQEIPFEVILLNLDELSRIATEGNTSYNNGNGISYTELCSLYEQGTAGSFEDEYKLIRHILKVSMENDFKKHFPDNIYDGDLWTLLKDINNVKRKAAKEAVKKGLWESVFKDLVS